MENENETPVEPEDDVAAGSEESGDVDDNSGGDNEETLTLEEALAEINLLRVQRGEARSESAGRRIELRDLKAASKKITDAELSELELLKNNNSDLETQVEKLKTSGKALVIKHALHSAAQDLNFHDPEMAIKLVKISNVEFDDENNTVSNSDSLLKKLAKKHPYLVKKSSKRTAPKNVDQNQLTPNKKDTKQALEASLRQRFGVP